MSDPRRSKGGGVVESQRKKCLPWELKTCIFRGYNPYIGGLKPSFFMVLGVQGTQQVKSEGFVDICYYPKDPGVCPFERD